MAITRQVAHSGDPELGALYEEVAGYGAEDEWPPVEAAAIALPIRIRHRGVELCLVNTITTFGAAFDITLDEVAVEAYFPGDDMTERFFQEGSGFR